MTWLQGDPGGCYQEKFLSFRMLRIAGSYEAMAPRIPMLIMDSANVNIELIEPSGTLTAEAIRVILAVSLAQIRALSLDVRFMAALPFYCFRWSCAVLSLLIWQFQSCYMGSCHFPVTSQEYVRDGNRNLRSLQAQRKFSVCKSGNMVKPYSSMVRSVFRFVVPAVWVSDSCVCWTFWCR